MIAMDSRIRRAPKKKARLKNIVFYGLSYPFAFLFFYLEPVNLGPINFASLWKVAALGAVFILVSLVPRYQMVPKVALLGILFSGLTLINPSLVADPIGTSVYALKYLYIPAIFIVLYGLHRKRKFTPNKLLRLATHVSIFISLSGIPFAAGILDSLSSKGYDLSLFGLEGSGFTGIFFNSHVASISMGTAAIVLIWNAKKSDNFLTLAFFILLAAFASYCVFQTFARTGYALAAFGIAIIIFFPFRALKLLAIAPLAAIAIFFTASIVIDNDLLMMRLQGQNIYTIASGAAGGDVTSGRTRFWAAAVDLFVNSPPEEWPLGPGQYYGMNRMQERVNMRISAHNDFFNALLFSGLIGFLSFVAYTFSLVQVSWSVRKNKLAGNLVIALVASYLVQMLVQGERVFFSELIMVLVIFSATVGDRQHLQKESENIP